MSQPIEAAGLLTVAFLIWVMAYAVLTESDWSLRVKLTAVVFLIFAGFYFGIVAVSVL